jgi:hypothetical protein
MSTGARARVTKPFGHRKPVPFRSLQHRRGGLSLPRHFKDFHAVF